MSLFVHESYIDIIQKYISDNHKIYGYKSQLADKIGVQRSYFSAVLNKKVHLTDVHIERLCRFWSLTEVETDFFFDLFNRDKAGSKELQEFYTRKILKHKQQSANLSKRFKKDDLLEQQQTIYYSNWIYSAVHMLTTIPEYQTLAAITQKLNLSSTVLHKVLTELVEIKLVEYVKGRWISKNNNVHLSSKSVFNSINHNNWRQRAVLNSTSSNLYVDNSVHYTALYTMSTADAINLKNLLFDFIDQSRKMVEKSKEEDLVCFSCDLFVP